MEYNYFKIIRDIILRKLRFRDIKLAMKLNDIYKKIQQKKRLKIKDIKYLKIKNIKRIIDIHNKYTESDNKIDRYTMKLAFQEFLATLKNNLNKGNIAIISTLVMGVSKKNPTMTISALTQFINNLKGDF